MKDPTREEIFAQAASQLRNEFQSASLLPHAGSKGAAVEDVVRTFLRSHLPRRFDVAGGFIIDHDDQVSKQTDVVVYDALNCPVYATASGVGGIFPNDNVAAVIEVKSSLDKQRLEEAADNIATAKQLKKSPLPRPWPARVTDTLGFIFAFESPLTLETLASHYQKLALEHMRTNSQIDGILLLDRALLAIFASVDELRSWVPALLVGPPPPVGTHAGVGIMDLGSRSLDAFFRLLLVQLSAFPHRVDHPGFDWSFGGKVPTVRIAYITALAQGTTTAEYEQNLAALVQRASEHFQENGSFVPVPVDAELATEHTGADSSAAERDSTNLRDTSDRDRPSSG